MSQLLKPPSDRPDAAIDTTIRTTVAAASTEWGLAFGGEHPEAGIGINIVRPQDVNISTTNNNWTLSVSTANAFARLSTICT